MSRQRHGSPPGSSHGQWSVGGGLSSRPRPQTVLGKYEVGARGLRSHLPTLKDARQSLANEAARSFDHPMKVSYAKERSARSPPSERDSMSRTQSPMSSPVSLSSGRRSSAGGDGRPFTPKLVPGDPNWVERMGSFNRLNRAGKGYHVQSKDSRIWAYPGMVQEASSKSGMKTGDQPWGEEDKEGQALVANMPSSSTLGTDVEDARVWQWLNQEHRGGNRERVGWGEAEERSLARARKRMRGLLLEVQANVSGSWARLKGFIAMHEQDVNPTSIPFNAQLKWIACDDRRDEDLFYKTKHWHYRQETRVCLDEGVISKALFEKVKIRLLRGSAAQDMPKGGESVPWCLDGPDAETWAASTTLSHPSFSSQQTTTAKSMLPAGKSWRIPSPATALIQSGRLRPTSKPENAAWAAAPPTTVYKPRRQSQVTVVHYDSYHGQEKMSEVRTESPSSDRGGSTRLQDLPLGVDLAFGKSIYAAHAAKERKDWMWEEEHGRWAEKNWMNRTNMVKKVKRDELWEQYNARSPALPPARAVGDARY